MLLLNRKDELKDRLKSGKEEWLNQYKFDFLSSKWGTKSLDDPEIIAYKKYIESQEDKNLMGV